MKSLRKIFNKRLLNSYPEHGTVMADVDQNKIEGKKKKTFPSTSETYKCQNQCLLSLGNLHASSLWASMGKCQLFIFL